MGSLKLSLPVGTIKAVPPAGLVLELEVPEPPPSECEVLDVQLAVSAPSGEYAIADHYPVTQTAGASGTKKWITAEWPVALPLCRVDPTGAAGSPMLKLGQGEGWVPLLASDPAKLVVPLLVGSSMKVPVTLTRRVMLDGNDVEASLKPWAQNRVQGLSASIGRAAPFFRHDGVLPPDGAVVLDGLLAAVNQYLAQNPGQRRIPLLLTAVVPGRLKLESFSGASGRVVRTLDGPDTLALSFGRKGVSRISLGGGGPVRGVELHVKAAQREEALYLATREPPASLGLMCDEKRALAQGLAALPKGVLPSSVDLYLRALIDPAAPVPFEGTLALHADAEGRPADTPLPKSECAIRLAEPAATWVSCALPAQGLERPFWLVLRGRKGQAVWSLGAQGTSQPQKGLGVLSRQGGEGWLPAPMAVPVALLRLHVIRQGPPQLPRIVLTRGAQGTGELVPGEDGRLVVREKAVLDGLNKSQDTVLSVQIETAAAARVTLADVRVRIE